jgi:hypothetical protein
VGHDSVSCQKFSEDSAALLILDAGYLCQSNLLCSLAWTFAVGLRFPESEVPSRQWRHANDNLRSHPSPRGNWQRTADFRQAALVVGKFLPRPFHA